MFYGPVIDGKSCNLPLIYQSLWRNLTIYCAFSNIF